MEQTPRFNGKVVKTLGDLNNKMAQHIRGAGDNYVPSSR